MRKYKPNTINKSKQKKREDFHYKYFMTTIFVGVIHYIFVESHYIGSDNRYDLFVFWIPVLIGLVLVVKFNILLIEWNNVLPTFKKEKNIFLKIIYFPFLFLVHFILSVIIFWIPSNIIWDGINKMESNKNQIETFTLNVTDFHHSTGKGGSNKIRFSFKGERESIRTSYQTIKPYLEKKPDDYQVVIEVKKGIWNYYVLQSWDIIQTSTQ